MHHIADAILKLWLMDEATFNQVEVTMAATYTQMLPGNPMRAALILGPHTSNNQFYAFGESKPTLGQTPIIYNGGQQSLVLTFDTIGQVIRYPLWGKQGGTAATAAVMEVSFNPKRFAMAMRWINEYLSEYASP